jgi:hypothetical protein
MPLRIIQVCTDVDRICDERLAQLLGSRASGIAPGWAAARLTKRKANLKSCILKEGVGLVLWFVL